MFRHSELVALQCGDVTLDRLDGAHVRLRRSKTDQDGTGTVWALPFAARHEHCPPSAHGTGERRSWWPFDAGGRIGVIRTLTKADPFEGHVCRGSIPGVTIRAPLLRSIRENRNL
ncbi:hypothetical protein EEB12_29390 [Rhodococcus sp. WS1]|nr:hypothetical protein EEB12_29390 [Rhodococcus sp. WS1]